MGASPYLDALDEASAGRRPPVEGDAARARLLASFSTQGRDAILDPSRFVVMRTARAAGKTAVMVADALIQMSTVPGWRGCYGSLTKESGIEQLWDELRRQDREFGFGLRFLSGRSEVVHPQTGARLKIRALDTKREVNKFRGKQFSRLYLDELQSIDDEVLSYAIVVVLPPTLSRHHGSMRLGGTPRMRLGGWWYAVTGPDGRIPARMNDGTVRAMARPWVERDDPMWAEIGWSWSLHTWPRSANPGLPDADRESDEMRRALAATEADRQAIAVELDGEWPDPENESVPRLFRFDPIRNTWVGGGIEANYGLPAGHEWSFYLGADLAIRWDQFALALGACSPTSPIAYHCDEDVGRRLTTAEMAARINRYRLALGTRLKAIVADSQGPTGHWIFEELSRVHRLPLERAKKGSKDDGVELISSDLVGGRMLIKAGSELARQLRELRRPFPTLPTSRQPHQKDDVADAWIYARRRMTHMFGRTPASAPDVAAAAAADKARQLQAMQRRQRDRLDPWAAIRGPVHGRF